MGLFSFAESRIKRMTVWDIGALKILCVLAGMLLGAYIAAFMLTYQLWFFIAAGVLLVVVLVRWFGKG